MDFRAQLKQFLIPGLPVFAAALLLSATSQAATNAVIPCEQVGRDLQSLSVPVAEMTVDLVDHVPVDPELIDEEPAVRESVAPVLDLGPRVTNILRDVFGATNDELLQESSEQASSSPVADSDENKDVAEVSDVTVEKTQLPRFQRQMLRTDI